MRSFSAASVLDDAGLTLELAPTLTPTGLAERPEFFSGFATQPLVLARGLLVLADVAQTRYFQPAPANARDPICSANGDRMRFESFSACNTVAVRLDLLAAAFDGGDIGHGTTNVDINQPLRDALGQVSPSKLLHLAVGHDELRLSTPERTHVERKVDLPDRWLKALGSSQELSRDLELVGEAPAAQARQFLAALPSGAGQVDAHLPGTHPRQQRRELPWHQRLLHAGRQHRIAHRLSCGDAAHLGGARVHRPPHHAQQPHLQHQADRGGDHVEAVRPHRTHRAAHLAPQHHPALHGRSA
ncbi:MAG: hypothetical protein Q4D79_07830 [Propionibacteriaceae bacterium]|nr:hypothetical protein [Propionibacteriaceae bacterium]